MALRRLLLVAVALVGTPLLAAPAKKTTPVAPATPAAGSGLGSGSAVEPIEEPPSATQMNGTEDNPDAPHALTTEEPAKPSVVAAPVKKVYPVELALRPITLTENLLEIEISPHLQASPFLFSDAIHARYGITDRLQVGVTYVYAGAWDRSLIESGVSSAVGFHVGKAFGVDVAYSIFDWMAVQAGLPVYVSPFAISLSVAVPLKFHITDNFALGGLDDLLNVSLHNFAPSFYQEFDNASAAANVGTNTQTSRGHLRFSVYGIYQYTSRFAIFGRLGIDDDLGTGGGNVPGETSNGGDFVYLKAAFLWTPVDYLDVGLQLGLDDLSRGGSFGPQAFLALRL